MKLTADYVPVKTPFEDKMGWKYPYSGDNWPTKDDWYWVWTGSKNNPSPTLFTLPKIRWWSGKNQRFLATDVDVYAWRRAARRL